MGSLDNFSKGREELDKKGMQIQDNASQKLLPAAKHVQTVAVNLETESEESQAIQNRLIEGIRGKNTEIADTKVKRPMENVTEGLSEIQKKRWI